jgi:predicted permease
MAQRSVWRRYARLFGPDPRADVADELRFHLEAKVDDLVAQGWQQEAARKEAERRFGDFRRVQEMGEQMGSETERRRQRGEFWGVLIQDLRYALRTLGRDRAFTVVAMLVLALGIGSNTAVFSVVNTVLLRPLPFADSSRLMWFSADRSITPELRANAGLSAVTYTVSAYQEFQRHNQSFQSVTSYDPYFANGEFTLTGRGEPQPVMGLLVAGNFFQTLGVQPALGRLFVPEECQKGGRAAVLLSHAFWRQRFSQDPAIVGQTITLSKQSMLVVGVLPAAFDFGSVFAPGMRFEVFVPAILDDMRDWGNTLALVGRLKPGVGLTQAQAEADALFPELRKANPKWWSDYASTITGLKEFVSGKQRRPLLLLWCAVDLILLIVCVNLSNLQIARATARSKEFALRTALGAARGRLFRQLLTESLVLTVGGAILGLAMAFALTFYLAHQGSIALPLLTDVTVDAPALGWTMLIAAATALLFGFIPSLRLAAGNIQDSLKNSGQGMSSGRQHQRLRSSMVIAEVALACVLLVSAGLLLRSFLRVLDVDLGFQPSRAGVIRIDYDDGGSPEKRSAILQEIQRRVGAIPGIESVGIADMLPLGRNRSWGFRPKGRESRPGDIALVRVVSPGYLSAMGMRLRGGRDFSWHDTPSGERVVIINQAAVRYFWTGEDPVGQLARINGRDARVIGVISDVREHSLEASVNPEMYLPQSQAGPEGAELVVRTKLPPEAVASAVMKTLRALNPNQPAAEFRPLQQIVDQSVSPRRFFMLMVTSFAAMGLVLAALGIYGVISYSVTQRTQEIGIRMALGASSRQVRFGVIGGALKLALAGAALGGIGAYAAARSMESLLFGAGTEPAIFATIILLLCAVALIAAYLPARRASGIEPIAALRVS